MASPINPVFVRENVLLIESKTQKWVTVKNVDGQNPDFDETAITFEYHNSETLNQDKSYGFFKLSDFEPIPIKEYQEKYPDNVRLENMAISQLKKLNMPMQITFAHELQTIIQALKNLDSALFDEVKRHVGKFR